MIVWSLPDGNVLRQFIHPGPVNDAAISPVDSSLIASAGADGIVRIWDTSTGGVVFAFDDHTEAVNAVAYSFDGKQLLSGSDDNTAILYSLDAGVATRTFDGHDGDVLSVAFSANNQAALTGSMDGNVRRFELSTGQVSDTYTPCSSPITAVAETLDGETILAGVAASTALQLDTDPAQGNDIDLRIPTGAFARQCADPRWRLDSAGHVLLLRRNRHRHYAGCAHILLGGGDRCGSLYADNQRGNAAGSARGRQGHGRVAVRGGAPAA